jgi:GH35 family endo-1,4-beta-xylanase
MRHPMKTNTRSDSNPITRRRFLRGISASGLLLAAPRAVAQDPVLASLRGLAGGKPLIGTSVQTQFDKIYTPEEIQILKTQFDSVTPENCMKWQFLCPKEGDYRFEPVDRLVDFATKNQQRVVGHTLIFNRDGNYPNWLFQDGGKEADAKLVWKRIEDHAGKLMSRYAGRIDSWDVLNEFVEVPSPGYRVTDLTRVLGADYPERLFKLAAQIDPKAKLTYNDFAVERPDRLKAILAFVRSLRDKGCKVDVVGSQSHLELGDEAVGNLGNMIQQFAAEGFRCALTELDVDVIPRAQHWNQKTREEANKQDPYVDGCPKEVLERQAAVYREIMKTVMANSKNVDRVTVWGISDRHSWLNKWPWKRVNHGLLFDREAKPKPAFHAIAESLKKG